MAKTIRIEGMDIHSQPTSIEVPENLGIAIQAAIRNANRVSRHPKGAAVLIELPGPDFPKNSSIAIAPESTPVAVIGIRQFDPRVSPYHTVAINPERDDIVGPLAGKFPELSGHTIDLKLRNPKSK